MMTHFNSKVLVTIDTNYSCHIKPIIGFIWKYRVQNLLSQSYGSISCHQLRITLGEGHTYMHTHTHMHTHTCTHTYTHKQTTNAYKLRKQQQLYETGHALAFVRLTSGLIMMEFVESYLEVQNFYPVFKFLSNFTQFSKSSSVSYIASRKCYKTLA